jgi:hypothetical protein
MEPASFAPPIEALSMAAHTGLAPPELVALILLLIKIARRSLPTATLTKAGDKTFSSHL